MGYHPTPRLVKEWAPTLELILQFVKEEKKGPLRLVVNDSTQLYRTQYTLRRALKAANVFKEEKEGRYIGLDKHIQIGVDDEESCITISRVKSEVPMLNPKSKDERDAIDSLRVAQGKMPLVSFYPSPDFDLGAFEEEARDLGWRLIRTLRVAEDEDEMLAGFEKIEQDTNAMQSLGFGGE